MGFAFLFFFVLCVCFGADLIRVDKDGAKCLDGSSPGLYYRKGDPKKWIVGVQGGGWCYTHDDCKQRALTDLG